MKRNLVGFCGVAAVALLAYGFTEGAAVDEEGVLLGPSNWRIAEGLLPEEILQHYQRGEYSNRIVDIEKPGYLSLDYPEEFRAASLGNRGRYELSDDGSIVDPETGKQPRFIFGLPFPDIDPSDPRAGVKIIWNYCYSTWYNGDEYFLSELVMLNRRGVERRIQIETRTRMYDGAPEARACHLLFIADLLQQLRHRVAGPGTVGRVVGEPERCEIHLRRRPRLVAGSDYPAIPAQGERIALQDSRRSDHCGLDGKSPGLGQHGPERHGHRQEDHSHGKGFRTPADPVVAVRHRHQLQPGGV